VSIYEQGWAAETVLLAFEQNLPNCQNDNYGSENYGDQEGYKHCLPCASAPNVRSVTLPLA
jgi:hypothetical protein